MTHPQGGQEVPVDRKKNVKKKKNKRKFQRTCPQSLTRQQNWSAQKGHWRQASRDGHRLCFCVLWRYTCRSEITRLLQSFGFVSTNFDVIAGLLRKVRITRWNLMESKMFLYDFIAHSVPHQSSFDCKSIGWSAWTQLGRKEFDEQLIQIESSWRLVH